MPAVTQLTTNFLSGVSTQTDDKKIEGQVTECINGYPDATFGLLKRPGMQYTNVLKKADTTAFTKTELANATWFFIDRATAGSYIGCIKGTNIYIWTADTGTLCTVTAPGGGGYSTSYLTGTIQNDYHFRSIQDTTIITNKTVTTAMQPAGTFVANAVATLKLLTLIETFEYTVTIQDIEVQVTTQNNTTFDDMLLYDAADVDINHHLIDKIKNVIEAQHTASNADFAGKWYLEGYNNSIVIKRSTGTNAVVTDYSAVTGTPVHFEIDARGGPSNTALEVFEDDVTDVSKLPLESFGGHNVRVLNSDSAEDDYYVKFVPYDTVLNRGRGYWKETIARDASPGLLASTMPHELANTGPTSFTFGPINYISRKSGDDVTSPIPSFIGKKINSTFFYSNRFGVLSEDNVILGVANDSYNFFVKSALTQISSDPIDLNVSSIRPVTLSDVLPSPQGLLLFSERQQFQLYATDASILRPASAVIRALSNYEMATDISPVDIGTTTALISRVPGYSKLFTLALRDVEQSPIVVDISKAVSGWIPETVDSLTTSPPNSVAMLVDRDTSYLYIYRYYNNGEKDLFQAWTKWELPGTIQAVKIINDDALIVQQHGDQYTIGALKLNEIPSGDVVSTNTSIVGNSCLDMATRPVSPDGGTTASVVYDEPNDITKIYVPYTPIVNKEATMLLTVPTGDLGTTSVIDSDQGYYASATPRVEIGTGFNYFEVKGNFVNYTDGIVVGYNYNLEIVLPKFYLRSDSRTTDYTAFLTIARVKFSVGRTGALEFKLKATGSNQWKDVQHTAEADYYSGDTNPVVSERIFTIPVHQRNTNFELKVTSNLPYPVSLVSMMWEGNYSPRFYRRA